MFRVIVFSLSLKSKPQHMNTTNLRFKNRKDMIPDVIEGQSFIEYIKSNNGGEYIAYGYIGIAGKKTHKFTASYININGENVIISLSSACGSQSYKSGLSSNLEMANDQVTCKKCCK